MKLEVTLSLPGRLSSEETQEKVRPFFSDKAQFTVTNLDYEYLDWSSIQTDSPMSTNIQLIAWLDDQPT